MKRLVILLFSMVMAGEMTVDGNLTVADTLHVTTIKSATNVVFIDSLLSLIDGNMEAGYHSVVWNANSAASGVYFVKMIAGDFVSTQKLMLIK